MVKLFRSMETNFIHNEWVLNEIIFCKVLDELNGDYTVELEYPLEDIKEISNNLVRGAILSIPTIDNRPDQLFRIIKSEKNENSITVEAQAKLLADLKANWCTPMTIVGKVRKDAITQILNSCLDRHNYAVGSLDNNINANVVINTEAGNPLTCIIGDNDNSVIKNYGGEFIINNNTIDIVDKRGANNGVVIEYGKNILGITETIDDTDLTTVLIPKSGDVYLPEYYIESPNVNKYEKRFFQEIDLNLNIWDGENEKGNDQITKEEAYILMRQICTNMFKNDKVDQLTFNYVVNFIELSKTEEYKDYKCLEKINVGDTVTIKHKKLNIDLDGRVNKIEYTVNSEGDTTVDNVEIGFSKKDLTDVINSTIRQIKITEQEILLRVQNAQNTLISEIKITATEIRSEVKDVENGLNSTISQTATEIRSEVNDTKNNLQSQITQNAEMISTKVSNSEFNSEIRQLANEISSKVSSGSEFSSELKQNVSAFKFLFNDASDGMTEISSDGLTVYDGGIEIQDKKGNTVFYIESDGTVHIKNCGIDDLNIYDTSKNSMFFNTLANMKRISCGEISPSRLTLDYRDFYIGSDGYDLKEFVERIIDGKNV